MTTITTVAADAICAADPVTWEEDVLRWRSRHQSALAAISFAQLVLLERDVALAEHARVVREHRRRLSEHGDRGEDGASRRASSHARIEQAHEAFRVGEQRLGRELRELITELQRIG